jgi:hypothetical protein
MKEVVCLKPDYMGFIYHPPSPSHFTTLPADLISRLNPVRH